MEIVIEHPPIREYNHIVFDGHLFFTTSQEWERIRKYVKLYENEAKTMYFELSGDDFVIVNMITLLDECVMHSVENVNKVQNNFKYINLTNDLFLLNLQEFINNSEEGILGMRSNYKTDSPFTQDKVCSYAFFLSWYKNSRDKSKSGIEKYEYMMEKKYPKAIKLWNKQRKNYKATEEWFEESFEKVINNEDDPGRAFYKFFIKKATKKHMEIMVDAWNEDKFVMDYTDAKKIFGHILKNFPKLCNIIMAFSDRPSEDDWDFILMFIRTLTIKNKEGLTGKCKSRGWDIYEYILESTCNLEGEELEKVYPVIDHLTSHNINPTRPTLKKFKGFPITTYIKDTIEYYLHECG